MNVFIVTEAGKTIGFGHLMRCVSIDQAFRRRAVKPVFIVNGDATVKKILKGKECRLFNWVRGQERLLKEIAGADIVLVDSYLADRALYESISNVVGSAVYIDDNKRLRYPAGVVVNTMVYADELRYPKSKGVDYLLGPSYAHLREEFRDVPVRKLRPSVENILVTLGGSDFLGLTPKILKILNRSFPDVTKTVVVGGFYTNGSEIKRAADRKTKIITHPDSAAMKKLMTNADFAITAAGQTVVELARVGVAALCLCVADNQRHHLRKWSECGFAGLLDPKDTKKLEGAIVKALAQFASLKSRREFRSRIVKIVNPRGSDRIAGELIKRVRTARKRVSL